jgi:transposase
MPFRILQFIKGPKQILKDFKGRLQPDGYSAYEFFKEQQEEQGGSITVLQCMAHARRKFYEALANEPRV